MVYTLYDRLVVGGAMPVNEVLTLETIDPLKSPFFLSRREFGTYNVGGSGKVKVDGVVFELNYKEALYLGAGDRTVTFESMDAANPAKFYFNSAPAHKTFPIVKLQSPTQWLPKWVRWKVRITVTSIKCWYVRYWKPASYKWE